MGTTTLLTQDERYDIYLGLARHVRDCYRSRFKNDHKATERLETGHEAVKQTLGEFSGGEGSYLVPSPLQATILDAVNEQTFARSRSMFIPMPSASLAIPIWSHVENTAAGEFSGHAGLTGTWTEAGTTKTETEPVLRQLKLAAKEYSGYTLISNALLADAPLDVIASVLSPLIVTAIAKQLDYVSLFGSGAGQPLGVLNSGALVSTARASANTISFADTISMVEDLYSDERSQSIIWLASRTAWGSIATQETTNGMLIWQPTSSGAQRVTAMHGFPAYRTEMLQPLGSAGDLTLIDFSQYVWGEREALAIDASQHYAFIDNQTTVRFSLRMDAQPKWDSAFTLADGSSTASPFVQLAA